MSGHERAVALPAVEHSVGEQKSLHLTISKSKTKVCFQFSLEVIYFASGAISAPGLQRGLGAHGPPARAAVDMVAGNA